MAVVNRTLDASEQKHTLQFFDKTLATGVTRVACHIPFPCVAVAANAGGFGVSGSPEIALLVKRFIPGTGATVLTLVASQVYQAYGTSGVPLAGLSLAASGSTLNNLLADDMILLKTAGANSAVTAIGGALIVQPIQDIKSFNNGLA